MSRYKPIGRGPEIPSVYFVQRLLLSCFLLGIEVYVRDAAPFPKFEMRDLRYLGRHPNFKFSASI